MEGFFLFMSYSSITWKFNELSWKLHLIALLRVFNQSTALSRIKKFKFICQVRVVRPEKADMLTWEGGQLFADSTGGLIINCIK